MDIFGIGIGEIILILVIVFLVMGPRDMAETGRKIGTTIRKILDSELWHTITHTKEELKDLSDSLIRESGAQEIKDLSRDVRSNLQDIKNTIHSLEIENRPSIPQDPSMDAESLDPNQTE
ncbi:MAG: twin-arginine translocase TatA/TatE family subunit [Anaerolineales bacterium]|nr:twin-arginine translocase TatA/TatE family subunit [Anaerolineales bacterium]